MISSEMKNCFKLHRLLFHYLPKFIVEWDPDFKTISLSKSYLTWLVWLGGMASGVLIMSGNAYVVLTHYLIAPRPNFHLTHAFIFVTGGLAVGIVILIGLQLLRRKEEIMTGFNKMHELDIRMTKLYRPEAFNRKGEFTNEGKPDLIGLMACGAIFLFATSPYWIVMFVIFQGFDCIHFILDDILPDPKYWDLKTILLATLTRIVLTSPSIIEMIRSLGYCLPINLVFLGFMFDCMHYLRHKIESLWEFIGCYLLFSLTYKHIEFVAGDLLFLVITIDYFGTVAALGFYIVGYDKIDIMMTISLTAGIIATLALTSYGFVSLKNINIIMEQMIRSRMIESNHRYAQIKTRNSRVLKCRIRALRVMRIPFGSFFYLRKDFGLEYFSNLTEHVVDSVLTFDLR